MSFEIHYDEDTGIIHTRFTGVLNTQVVGEFAQRMGDMMRDHPARSGYLIDVTEAQVSLSIVDMYNVPGVLRSHSETQYRSRAILVNPADHDKFKFLETTASNRGYSMRIFTDRGAAEDWLNASA